VPAFPFRQRASPEDRANGASESSTTRPRLVIADDDLVIQTLFSASLEHDFEVVGVAGDGEAAIELAKDRQPDVMLIDVQMPGGGGMRAVSGITEVAPQVAIVVLTGDESDVAVNELMRAGAVAFCRKGIDPGELTELLIDSIAVRAQELARSRPQLSPVPTA
jgi:DNA-binding NarL/FixJ family response regulator